MVILARFCLVHPFLSTIFANSGILDFASTKPKESVAIHNTFALMKPFFWNRCPLFPPTGRPDSSEVHFAVRGVVDR